MKKSIISLLLYSIITISNAYNINGFEKKLIEGEKNAYFIENLDGLLKINDQLFVMQQVEINNNSYGYIVEAKNCSNGVGYAYSIRAELFKNPYNVRPADYHNEFWVINSFSISDKIITIMCNNYNSGKYKNKNIFEVNY